MGNTKKIETIDAYERNPEAHFTETGMIAINGRGFRYDDCAGAMDLAEKILRDAETDLAYISSENGEPELIGILKYEGKCYRLKTANIRAGYYFKMYFQPVNIVSYAF